MTMDKTVDLSNLFNLFDKFNINAKIVAEATGISAGNISDWKKGRSYPTASKMIVLADYLGCSIDYLCGRTDIPNPIIAEQDTVHKFLKRDGNFIELEKLIIPPVLNNRVYFIPKDKFPLLLEIYRQAAEADTSIPDNDTEFKAIFKDAEGGYSIHPREYAKVIKIYNVYQNQYFTNILKNK